MDFYAYKVAIITSVNSHKNYSLKIQIQASRLFNVYPGSQLFIVTCASGFLHIQGCNFCSRYWRYPHRDVKKELNIGKERCFGFMCHFRMVTLKKSTLNVHSVLHGWFRKRKHQTGRNVLGGFWWWYKTLEYLWSFQSPIVCLYKISEKKNNLILNLLVRARAKARDRWWRVEVASSMVTNS